MPQNDFNINREMIANLEKALEQAKNGEVSNYMLITLDHKGMASMSYSLANFYLAIGHLEWAKQHMLQKAGGQ